MCDSKLKSRIAPEVVYYNFHLSYNTSKRLQRIRAGQTAESQLNAMRGVAKKLVD